MSYQIVQDNFHRACQNAQDINNHLHTLYQYALKSNSIIECSTQPMVSTWALLKGLIDNPSTQPKSLICCDRDFASQSSTIAKICIDLKINYRFQVGNHLFQDFPSADLVFINTWHVYGQLCRELSHFVDICQKYIIMHNTTVDGTIGESIRENMNIDHQSHQHHIPVPEIKLGLWPAVENFLGQHPTYRIKRSEKYNNGLTVLEKANREFPKEMIIVATYSNQPFDRRMIQIWRKLRLEADVFFVRAAENMPIFYMFEDSTLWVNLRNANIDQLHQHANHFFQSRIPHYTKVITTTTTDVPLGNITHHFDLSKEGIDIMLHVLSYKLDNLDDLRVDVNDPLLFD